MGFELECMHAQVCCAPCSQTQENGQNVLASCERELLSVVQKDAFVSSSLRLLSIFYNNNNEKKKLAHEITNSKVNKNLFEFEFFFSQDFFQVFQ